jgi:hypothetical protein
VNFEAFRKRPYSTFDLTPGPHSNDPVETKSIVDIDAADTGMSVNAAHESGMKHIRQTNIGNVQALACNEPTRFIRFDVAPDVSNRYLRHQQT